MSTKTFEATEVPQCSSIFYRNKLLLRVDSKGLLGLWGPGSGHPGLSLISQLLSNIEMGLFTVCIYNFFKSISKGSSILSRTTIHFDLALPAAQSYVLKLYIILDILKWYPSNLNMYSRLHV